MASSPPWAKSLKGSFEKNYPTAAAAAKKSSPPSGKEPVEDVYVQMATITQRGANPGRPALYSVPFLDMLEDDNRFLVFAVQLNNAAIMADIRNSNFVELSWTMSKTLELYQLSGRMYLASPTTILHRHPPPRLSPDTPAEDYWESLRLRYWKRLDPRTRATFAWPASGSRPRLSANQFRPTTMACLEDAAVVAPGTTTSTSRDPPVDSQKKLEHDMARDNFALLVFKCTELDHLQNASVPANRTVYSSADRNYVWSVEDVNP